MRKHWWSDALTWAVVLVLSLVFLCSMEQFVRLFTKQREKSEVKVEPIQVQPVDYARIKELIQEEVAGIKITQVAIQPTEDYRIPNEFIATAYGPTGQDTALNFPPTRGTVAVRDRRLLGQLFLLWGGPPEVNSMLVAVDLLPEVIRGQKVEMNRIDIYMPSTNSARQLGRMKFSVMGRRTDSNVIVLRYEGKTEEQLGR